MAPFELDWRVPISLTVVTNRVEEHLDVLDTSCLAAARFG
jgi:hypothetical protein